MQKGLVTKREERSVGTLCIKRQANPCIFHKSILEQNKRKTSNEKNLKSRKKEKCCSVIRSQERTKLALHSTTTSTRA